MSMKLQVVDLSHWDPASDYEAVAAAGVIGVIYKSTQGTGYTDPTYKAQKKAALSAGLCWGSYHFGDCSDPEYQAENYLAFTKIEDNELFCLDFEDNQDCAMSINQAQTFIMTVEKALNRDGQCVFYSGNRVKDLLGTKKNAFLGERRLWLAQYGNTPQVQASWTETGYWLWQYSDGVYGPTPHEVDGVGPCDCNISAMSDADLCAQWATGSSTAPPEPPLATVRVIAPPGVKVIVQGGG